MMEQTNTVVAFLLILFPAVPAVVLVAWMWALGRKKQLTPADDVVTSVVIPVAGVIWLFGGLLGHVDCFTQCGSETVYTDKVVAGSVLALAALPILLHYARAKGARRK